MLKESLVVDHCVLADFTFTGCQISLLDHTSCGLTLTFRASLRESAQECVKGRVKEVELVRVEERIEEDKASIPHAVY